MILGGCPPSQWQPSKLHLVSGCPEAQKVEILGQPWEGGTAQPMIFFFQRGHWSRHWNPLESYIPENWPYPKWWFEKCTSFQIWRFSVIIQVSFRGCIHVQPWKHGTWLRIIFWTWQTHWRLRRVWAKGMFYGAGLKLCQEHHVFGFMGTSVRLTSKKTRATWCVQDIERSNYLSNWRSVTTPHLIPASRAQKNTHLKLAWIWHWRHEIVIVLTWIPRGALIHGVVWRKFLVWILELRPILQSDILLMATQKSGEKTSSGNGSLSHYLRRF